MKWNPDIRRRPRRATRLLALVLSGGLLFATTAAAQQALTAENTCNLQDTPPQAVRVEVPSSPTLFHYPDPRAVPKDYSGCLNTWLEGNVRAMQARFVAGRVTWFRIGNNDVYCEYENDRVVKQVVDEALLRQMARSGMAASYCPPAADLAPPRWR